MYCHLENRSLSQGGKSLAMAALDAVPQSKENAAVITALVKKSGRICGYRLSDGRTVSRDEGVALAEAGEIAGVGIAHRGETRYLKALPDGSENNNLNALPTVSASSSR